MSRQSYHLHELGKQFKEGVSKLTSLVAIEEGVGIHFCAQMSYVGLSRSLNRKWGKIELLKNNMSIILEGKANISQTLIQRLPTNARLRRFTISLLLHLSIC